MASVNIAIVRAIYLDRRDVFSLTKLLEIARPFFYGIDMFCFYASWPTCLNDYVLGDIE